MIYVVFDCYIHRVTDVEREIECVTTYVQVGLYAFGEIRCGASFLLCGLLQVSIYGLRPNLLRRD